MSLLFKKKEKNEITHTSPREKDSTNYQSTTHTHTSSIIRDYGGVRSSDKHYYYTHTHTLVVTIIISLLFFPRKSCPWTHLQPVVSGRFTTTSTPTPSVNRQFFGQIKPLMTCTLVTLSLSLNYYYLKFLCLNDIINFDEDRVWW